MGKVSYSNILCIAVAIALILVCLIYASKYESVNTLAIFGAAFVAPYFAIRKYKSEQRTNRLQKLYFEDVFLESIRMIEENILLARKNMHLVQGYYNTLNYIYLGDEDYIPENIGNLTTDLITEINLGVSHLGFEKHSIHRILLKSGYKSAILLKWLDKLESDTLQFTNYLLIDMRKIHLQGGVDSSELIEKSKQINMSFIYIKRHTILLVILSALVNELASHDFESVEKIYDYLCSEDIKKIIEFIDYSYGKLDVDVDLLEYGFVRTRRFELLNGQFLECLKEAERL